MNHSQTDAAVQASLRALEPEALEARSAVERLQTELAMAQRRAQQLAAVVENLHALANGNTRVVLGGQDILNAKPTDTGRDESVNLPDAATATSDVQAQQPKRIQSTELVAAIVNEASPHLITREEVLDAMTNKGHTEGMKDPKNSITTALYRASQRGLIRRLDRDTYQAIDVPDSHQTPEVQTDLGLQGPEEEIQ